VLHWWIVPFVVCQWVTRPWWAGLFSFIQVFTLWTLNLIAVELENPFGTDANDIDGTGMQLAMNNSLRLLLRAENMNMPFCECDGLSERQLMNKAIEKADSSGRVTSFHAVWSKMDSMDVKGFSEKGFGEKKGSVRSYRAQVNIATAANAKSSTRLSVPVPRRSHGSLSSSHVKASGALETLKVSGDAGCWKELPVEDQHLWTPEHTQTDVAQERREEVAELPQDSDTCEVSAPSSQKKPSGGTPPSLDGPAAMNPPLCCVPAGEMRQISRHSPTPPSEDGRATESCTTEEALQLRWNQIFISMDDLEGQTGRDLEYAVEHYGGGEQRPADTKSTLSSPKQPVAAANIKADRI